MKTRKTNKQGTTIGELLRTRRESKNMTVTQLAELTKVNRSIINRTENGETTPSNNTIAKLFSSLS